MSDANELKPEELKVLRRLAKGPTSSVDRLTAGRLQDRGLVGRVPMVSWTFCITDAGRAALSKARPASSVSKEG